MKALTFDTFIQHPSNQNAYDLCKKLARFDDTLKNPIVLLGDSGAGKTHLLWAVVNHYRAGQTPVGIALISPVSFPEVVKDLASKPEKLTAATPVVLLVDDLHGFDRASAGDLERVLFALQEHGHYAILAAQQHPTLIPALSGKCKAFLNDGSVVGINPLPGRVNAPKDASETSAVPDATGVTAKDVKPGYLSAAQEMPEALAAALQEHAEAALEELREFLYAWDLNPPTRKTRDKSAWEDSGEMFHALAEKLDMAAETISQMCRGESPRNFTIKK